MPVQIEDPQILAGICGDYALPGTRMQFLYGMYSGEKEKRNQDADIIITNHSLVLADFLEREVLPKYSILILDEAHNFYNNAVKRQQELSLLNGSFTWSGNLKVNTAVLISRR